MNKALHKMLTRDEQTLVLETEPKRLEPLDEDALVDLHGRIRRARNKYSKLYRRQASAQVVQDASRAKASSKHSQTAARAEVFEDALARVSRALSAAARASAAELREERLDAARSVKGGETRAGGSAAKGRAASRDGGKGRQGGKTTKRGDAAHRSPVGKKKAASARAAGRRTQAKRDSR